MTSRILVLDLNKQFYVSLLHYVSGKERGISFFFSLLVEVAHDEARAKASNKTYSKPETKKISK